MFDGAGENGERGEGGDGGVHVHGERGPVGARMETGERLTGELRNRKLLLLSKWKEGNAAALQLHPAAGGERRRKQNSIASGSF